jgi:hypothetical protein
VLPDNVFYPFVRCLACRDIVTGYSDGTFRPNTLITRGQVAKIVALAAGFSDPSVPQIYEDVPPDDTFYDFVQMLSANGVIGGYDCGQVPQEPCVLPGNRPYFRPGFNATRGQLSKIVSEAAGINGSVSGQTFEDVPETHPFYIWIERLALRYIIAGYPCGGPGEPCGPGNRPYLRPGNGVTRGQASKIVSSTFFPTCDP